MPVRWSRSFGQLEGFVKVYSGSEITSSSSVWYLMIDDEVLWSLWESRGPDAGMGGGDRLLDLDRSIKEGTIRHPACDMGAALLFVDCYLAHS